MTEPYDFSVGDLLVIRMEINGLERWGQVMDVTGNGSAKVKLYRGPGFPKESTMLILSTGLTHLKAFMVIKHVTTQEQMESGFNGLQRKS